MSGNSATPAPIPETLAELQRRFLIEATKCSVLPLDDRTFERMNPDLTDPRLINGNSQILFGDMFLLSEGSVPVTHNKSYSLTAEIEVPKSGVIGSGDDSGACLDSLFPNGPLIQMWRLTRPWVTPEPLYRGFRMGTA